MIFDMNKIAGRFEGHIDPTPEQMEKARAAVADMFQRGRLDIGHVQRCDLIIDFAATYGIYCKQRRQLEDGETVERPIDMPRRGLWLFGGCGTGKSHTVKVLSAGLRVDFYDIREIDREYSKHGYKIFQDNSAINRDVCIIDDIGSEAGSRFFSNPPVIEYLLEHRHQLWMNRGIPTIFTTNFKNSDAIAETYNPRIRSRVFEMCDAVFYGTNDQRIPAKAG